MDELKSHLQKEIEKAFQKRVENCEGAAVGIIKGVIPEYIHQLQSGQFSRNEKNQALGDTWYEFNIREEHREQAYYWLKGFLYGIEAAGILTREESDSLREEVGDIRLDENRDSFLRTLKNTPSKASVEL